MCWRARSPPGSSLLLGALWLLNHSFCLGLRCSRKRDDGPYSAALSPTPYTTASRAPTSLSCAASAFFVCPHELHLLPTVLPPVLTPVLPCCAALLARVARSTAETAAPAARFVAELKLLPRSFVVASLQVLPLLLVCRRQPTRLGHVACNKANSCRPWRHPSHELRGRILHLCGHAKR